jgi:hypothetical protein
MISFVNVIYLRCLSQSEGDWFEFFAPTSDDQLFISIWDSDFPQRVFNWIKAREEVKQSRG